jgi:antitoxin component of MazEF toxin-antitoxin module
MKIIIEEWDGDGAIRIPDEALQELELDVGDAVYLIEEFVGNTRCLVLSKTPQIADRSLVPLLNARPTQVLAEEATAH